MNRRLSRITLAALFVAWAVYAVGYYRAASRCSRAGGIPVTSALVPWVICIKAGAR